MLHPQGRTKRKPLQQKRLVTTLFVMASKAIVVPTRMRLPSFDWDMIMQSLAVPSKDVPPIILNGIVKNFLQKKYFSITKTYRSNQQKILFFVTKGMKKNDDWVQSNHYKQIPAWTLQRCLTFMSLSEPTQRKLPGDQPVGTIKEEVGQRIRRLIANAEPPSQDELSDTEQRLIIDTANALTFLINWRYPDFQMGPIAHSQNYAAFQEAIINLSTHATNVVFYLCSAKKVDPNLPTSSSPVSGETDTSNSQNDLSMDPSPHVSHNAATEIAPSIASNSSATTLPTNVRFLGVQDPNMAPLEHGVSPDTNANQHRQASTATAFAYAPKLQQKEIRQTSFDDIETRWDIETCLGFLLLSEASQKLLPGAKATREVKRTICKRLDFLIGQKAGTRIRSKPSFLLTVVALFNTNIAIIRSALPGVAPILTGNSLTVETLLALSGLKLLHEQLRHVIEQINENRRHYLEMLVRV